MSELELEDAEKNELDDSCGADRSWEAVLALAFRVVGSSLKLPFK